MVSRPTAERNIGTNLPSLTGIRFVAAVVVFTHHAISVYDSGGNTESWLRTTPSMLTMFFMTSGFVMVWTHRPNDGPRVFYERRIARILPMYLVAVLAGIVWTSRTGNLPGLETIPQVFLLQCWFPSESVYFANNIVLWSLSCEAFFYVVFPFLVRIVLPLSTRAIALLTVLCGLAALLPPLILSPKSQDDSIALWLVYVFPPTRLLEFMMGMGIAILVIRGVRCPISVSWSLVVVVAGLVAFNWLPPALGWSAAMVLPWALFVWAASTSDVLGIRTPLNHRLAEHAGEWSFSFYVSHWLILQATASFFRSFGIYAPVIAQVLIAFIIAVGVAAFCYHFIERTSQRALLKRFRQRTTRATVYQS